VPCTDKIQLAPGASCQVRIDFGTHELTSGTAKGIATISGDPGGTLAVPLTAQVGHFVEITLDGQPFGDDYVFPSMQSAVDVDKTVSIRNVSQTTIPDVNVFGYFGNWLTTDTGTCTAPLVPGAICSFTLRAHASGQAYGSSANMALAVYAAGERRLGVGAWVSALQLSRARMPPSRDGRDLIISNVSGHDVDGLSIASSSTEGYSIGSNTCTSKLAVGQSCTLHISFVPVPLSGGGYDKWPISATGEGSFPLDLSFAR